MNLINFFKPNPYLLPFSKTEKESLEYFVTYKKAFEQWLLQNPQPRVRFQFFYPTAVDFYFDEFKLFTAYFKKDGWEGLQLKELKMSRSNYTSIRTRSWKPFEEVILHFLTTFEETTQLQLFQKNKPLHEYVAICEGANAAQSSASAAIKSLTPSMATG